MAFDYAALAVAAFAIAAVVTPLVRGYARRRLIDVPTERSSHEQPTPRGGGVAIVLAVSAASIGGVDALGRDPAPELMGIIAAALVIAAIGFWDDHASLSARGRLVVHAAVVAAVLYLLPPPAEIRVCGLVVAAPQWVASGLWLFAALGVVNLTNFMDGIDGISGSQAAVYGAAVSSFAFVGVFDADTIGVLMPLGAATLGGSLGFLLYNWPPASIFMGDVGSTFLGLIYVALILVMARAGIDIDIALLPVIPFLADGTFTLARRFVRRERVTEAHRSHLYQRLARHWGSHGRVTILYAILALLGVALSVMTLAELIPGGVGLFAWFAVFALVSIYGRRVAPA